MVKNMIKKMKSMNRALLELESGIVLYAVIGQMIGFFFRKSFWNYSIGWVSGIITAGLLAWHMWYTLDKALDFPESTVKKVRIAAVIRYLVCILVLVVLAVTNIGNPVAGFFGIWGLKVAAYMQPFTHKFYNKIFHEQDPVPQPLSDEEFYEVYSGEAESKGN